MRRTGCLLAALILLAACGSGGGDEVGAVAITPAPTPAARQQELPALVLPVALDGSFRFACD